MPYDFVRPGIYTIDCNESLQVLLHEIKQKCIEDNLMFEFYYSLIINTFIMTLLTGIPHDIWQNTEIDQRIVRTLQYINKNIESKIENNDLAQIANMATNSFSRIFKLQMGETIQQYVFKRRIEKARLMLHHSNESIDNIAAECGFCDRHHFTKVFKNMVSMSPAYYKKHLKL